MKVNCWEHKACGREPGGERVAELGVCPAADCAEAHGINGGTNGGRVCWMVAGTLCGDRRQVELTAKVKDCTECDFLGLVRAQEPMIELPLA